MGLPPCGSTPVGVSDVGQIAGLSPDAFTPKDLLACRYAAARGSIGKRRQWIRNRSASKNGAMWAGTPGASESSRESRLLPSEIVRCVRFIGKSGSPLSGSSRWWTQADFDFPANWRRASIFLHQEVHPRRAISDETLDQRVGRA
jgi:hypothetical protein